MRNETKRDVFKDLVEELASAYIALYDEGIGENLTNEEKQAYLKDYDTALPDNLSGTGGGEMNMTRKCYVVSEDKENPAKFYGVFQVAKVVGESPLIGGHSAGQIMEPVAVVEYNSQLHKVYLNQVHFEDEEED